MKFILLAGALRAFSTPWNTGFKIILNADNKCNVIKTKK